MTEGTPSHGRGKRRITTGWIGWTLLAVVLILGLWVGWRSYQAATGLTEARVAAARINLGMSQGALPDLADVATAQQGASKAVAATSDPIYNAATYIPWVGAQLGAVQAVALSINDVTTDVLPPLIETIDSVGSLRAEDGRFDIALLKVQAKQVGAADDAAQKALARLLEIDTNQLLPEVSDGVTQARTGLTDVAYTVAQAHNVIELLPEMLGGDRPRTYAVLALNNAELRPAGGIVGSVIELSVDQGRVTIGRQLAASSLAGLDQPIVALTEEELAIDGDRLGRYLQNSSLTPDFPRTAELVAARWQHEVGTELDGVIAVDAVAVAQLLDAVAPIGPDGTPLLGDGFVASVLRDPYLTEVDQAAADQQFAQVAAVVFAGLLASDLDGTDMLTSIRRIVSEQRLHIWSADPAEQSILVDSTVGGAFLTGPFDQDGGIFLTDTTGGKVDYYLTTTTRLECTEEGAKAILTLTYQPPADVATVSVYLRGPDAPDRTPGNATLAVSIYPPVDANVGTVVIGDQTVGGESITRAGRQGIRVPVVLQPSGSASVEVELVNAPSMTGLWTTPAVDRAGLLACDEG